MQTNTPKQPTDKLTVESTVRSLIQKLESARQSNPACKGYRTVIGSHHITVLSLDNHHAKDKLAEIEAKGQTFVLGYTHVLAIEYYAYAGMYDDDMSVAYISLPPQEGKRVIRKLVCVRKTSDGKPDFEYLLRDRGALDKALNLLRSDNSLPLRDS